MNKLRTGFLLVVLLIVGAYAAHEPKILQQWVQNILWPEAVPANGEYSSPKPLRRNAAESKFITTANQFHQDLNTRYQLKPDRRFILAAVQLQMFLGKTEFIKSDLIWTGSEWSVSIGEIRVGSLDSLPDYQSGFGFIESWLSELEAQYSFNFVSASGDNNHTVSAGGDGYNPKYLLSNLKHLNIEWATGPGNGNILHEVVKNLTRLAVIGRDRLGFADDLVSKALAFIVLAMRVNPEIDYSEYQSQMAYAMGYQADAEYFAGQLESKNPWRRYLFKHDRELYSSINSSTGSPEAKFYFLKRLADEGYSKAWYEYLDRYYAKEEAPFHALMTGYDLPGTNTFRYLSNAIPLVVIEYAGGTPVWEKMSNKLVPYLPVLYGKALEFVVEIMKELQRPGVDDTYRQFNTNLDKHENQFLGPFMDAKSWRLLQQSFFTNSIYNHGIFLTDSIEDSAAGKDFAKELDKVESTDAKLLASYFELLARAIDSRVSETEVLNLISSTIVFGAEPMFRLFEEIELNLKFGSPKVKNLMYKIVSVMDSRIDNRYDYANTMRKHLLDLSAAHKVFESIARDSPNSSTSVQVWLAKYFDNHEEIERLLHRRENTLRGVLYSLDILKSELKQKIGIDKLFLTLVERFPSSWKLRKRYIEALEVEKRYKEARYQALKWKDHKSSNVHWTAPLRSRVFVARSYRFEKNFKKASETLAPTLIDKYGWGFYEATEVAIALKKYTEAVELAERVRKRFPSSKHSMKNLLRAYWSNKEYENAAQLIDKNKPYSESYWRWTLAQMFAEVFNNDLTSGLQAIDALLNTDIDHIKLSNFAFMAEESGANELAFEISKKLVYPGIGILTYKIDAYRALESWQGEEKAIAWLRGEVPSDWRNTSSEIIIYKKLYHLLWDLIDRPEEGIYPYGVWSIRAVAYVLEENKDSGRYTQLTRYYSSPDHNNYYDKLGRIALGFESGDDLLGTELSLKKIGEVAFYKGVQEYGKGNLYAAADWFRVVVETGITGNGEYKWAYGMLYVWMTRSKDITLQIALPNYIH